MFPSTTKHLSYAGITLPLATPQLERYVEELKPLRHFTEADFYHFDNPVHQRGLLPSPTIPVMPEFALGRLYWPTGASRPAWFHAVVNQTRLDAIRTAVGDPGTPQSLTFSDGRTGKTVTASMYMLPARPLNILGSPDNDGWLLTLTDQRFFWYWRRGSVTSRPLSWTHLYSTLGTTLGVTVVADAINSAYGQPSAKWVGYHLPTPVVLDAAAATIGQRIVVALDGTVRAVNWEGAQTASDTLSDDRVEMLGGFVEDADVARYVPATVRTLFQDLSGVPTNAPFAVNTTLASLAITAYGTSTGMASHAQVVYADLAYTGANAAAANAYASAAAEDWYGWRLADADVSYPGIEPWLPTGWEDAIEWTLQLRETTIWEVESGSPGDGVPDPFASTVVRRGPWTDLPAGGLPPQETPVPGPNGCDETGWGWVAGLLHLPSASPPFSECLRLTVNFANGYCAGISTSQVLYLRTTDGITWRSQRWDCEADPPAWVDENFVCDPSSVAGPAIFTPDTSTTTSVPRLMLCGISYSLTLVCGGDGVVMFEGGGPNYCNGAVPTEECLPNTFQVKLECVCCSIPGWQGPGWYCVCESGDDCDTCDTVAVELIESDRCDGEITICSCRFDTQEEAEVECTGGVTTWNCTDGDCVPVSGAGGTYATLGQCQENCGITGTSCCGSTPVPGTLNVAFSGATGTCGCFNGVTAVMVFDAGLGLWTGSVTTCGFTFDVIMTQTCSFGLSGGGCVSPGVFGITTTCGPPFSGTVTAMPVTGCCTGTVNVAITVP